MEFIHILEGSLRYRHGPESFLLKLPVRMLSIIVYGGEGDAD